MAARKSKTRRKTAARSRRSRRAARTRNSIEQQAKSRPELILSQLRPKPLPDEPVEDLAVFIRDRREELPEDLQGQAEAVSDALDLTYQGSFDESIERLKVIPRRSLYSDWRLFIRGLVAFYCRDIDTARTNWSRLDRTRRPARIASTFLLAETGEPLCPELQSPQRLVDTAKSLRIERGAVELARQIAAVGHRKSSTVFSASQAAMLTTLCSQYRRIDGDFVATFSQACVRLAHFQPNNNIFDLVTRAATGPAHDPRWNLQKAIYLTQFIDADEAMDQAIDKYVNNDLPKLTHIPKELRDALAGTVYLIRAETAQQANEEPRTPFLFSGGELDLEPAKKYLKTSIKYCPLNRRAHQQLLDILKRQLDNRHLDKRKKESLQKQVIKAKAEFVHVFSDEVETALFLIDHYFEEDEIDKAKAIFAKLSDQRFEDPRAKALPWKLKMREAMYFSRRKTRLAEARKALEKAQAIWPSWLNQRWLPFLEAAIEYRAGNHEDFSRLDQAAREASGIVPWVADMMTFSALQQMHLPSTSLKPFRTGIDDNVSIAESAPLNEICSLASFLWDLTRAGLRHKAYRLQVNKYGKILLDRLEFAGQLQLTPDFVDACCWLAHHHFWSNNCYAGFPKWLDAYTEQDARIAAAGLQATLDSYYAPNFIKTHSHLVDLVEQAARVENDPYYRFRLEKVAKDSRAALAEAEQRTRTFMPFTPTFEEDDEDNDFDDEYFGDEYSDGDDECECDCPACRAERQTRTAQDDENSNWFAADEKDGEFSSADVPGKDDEIPPIIIRVINRLGWEKFTEMRQRLNEAGFAKSGGPAEPQLAEIMTEVFAETGLTRTDCIEFVAACLGSDEPELDLPNPTPTSMNPQERREERARRRNELNKKKKKRR